MSDWRKSAACAGYDPALWFPGNIDFLTGLKSRDSCCRSDVSFLMEEIPTGIAGV